MPRSVQTISVAVMLADRPDVTVRQTVENCIRGGFTSFHLSAEPDTEVPNDLPCGPHSIHRHEEKVGMVPHAKFCWQWLFAETDSRYLMLCENDIRFSPSAKSTLESLLAREDQNPFGYATLFTPAGYSPWIYRRPILEGWVDWRPGIGNSAGQCLCLRREVLAEMMQGTDWSPRDGDVGKWCVDRGLPCWYALPSLCEHVSSYSLRLKAEWHGHTGLEYRDDR